MPPEDAIRELTSSGPLRCCQPRRALHQLHRLLHRMPHPGAQAQEDNRREGDRLAEVRNPPVTRHASPAPFRRQRFMFHPFRSPVRYR